MIDYAILAAGVTFHVATVHSLGTFLILFLLVIIDIKPGIFENRVNSVLWGRMQPYKPHSYHMKRVHLKQDSDSHPFTCSRFSRASFTELILLTTYV